MRILVVGDFHGKCNIPLKGIIKKEKIDLILSPGDFCGDVRVAELFFKHMYDSDEDDVPLRVMKRIDKYEVEGIKAGFEVIRKMKSLKKRLILGLEGIGILWNINGILGAILERGIKDILKEYLRCKKKALNLLI